MLYERETTGTVAQVSEKLEAAAAANKFGVLGTHDLKERMAAKGVQFGPECRIIEVCNPHQAKLVLERNMAISTAMPCRISVYQAGPRVRVAMIRPTAALGMFGNPDLEPVARDVENTMIRIIDAACK